MPVCDIAKSNQSVSSGASIIDSGGNVSNLVILQKGIVEISFSGPGSGVICDLSSPSVLGSSQFFLGQSSVGVHAKGDCVVSCYTADPQNLVKIIASKPSLGLLMIKSLVKEIIEFYNKDNLANSVNRLFYNQFALMSLGYAILHQDKFVDKKIDSGFEDPVLTKANKVYENFINSERSLPGVIDEAFLKQNFVSLFDSSQDPISFNKDEFLYYRRIADLPQNVLGSIAQKDPFFLIETIRRMSQLFKELQNSLINKYNEQLDIVNMFYQSSYGWFDKVILDIDKSKVDINSFQPFGFNEYIKFFKNTIITQKNQFLKLWKDGYPQINSAYFEKISNLVINAEKNKKLENVKSAPDSQEDIAKNMMQKIASWVQFPNDKFNELRKHLTELKKYDTLIDSNARQIRRKINQFHLELYEMVALKYLPNRSSVPPYIKMFLKFGVLDETLLEPEHLTFLANNLQNETSKYPIYNAIEWLEFVYDGKVSTSINDLGLTFFEILRQENRNEKWKRESDLPPHMNTPEARIQYEIKSMFEPTIKLTSGQVINNFSPLNSQGIMPKIEKAYTTKKALEDQISTLLSIDFSAFYREVLYSNENLGINREFVQVEIIPNFILVPSAGPIYQFWQEKEDKDRMSRGRLVGPIISNGDLFDMLLSVSAGYRWELTKTLLGADWNNISQSSITADYTDYVQFFKKNRELSTEMKEKLSLEFKRFRDDRTRFINDYLLYIKYESEGTQRLNRVARRILCKHIPFVKSIRDKLLKLPNYTNPITKANNIRSRKARDMEPRYRKIRAQNDGALPTEIEHTIKFYNGDI